MRILSAVGLSAFLLSATASSAAADVQIVLANGRVTLVATNATARQILTEWARVGQTKIVNVDRIPGGPLTLQFSGVPEEDVLDILLQAAGGYLAAPRRTPAANLSRFDRIMVMPTAAVPRTTTALPAPMVAQQPVLQLAAPADDEQNDGPSIVTPPRGGGFQTFPQPPLTNQQSPAVSPAQPVPAQVVPPQATEPPPATTYPGASTATGSPRPGMVVQPVLPPGQTGPTSRPD